jgi:peptidoglycan/xylan/chitin deacetylase (PgdA/CDA1 family)
LTFDDGYADNLFEALPRLERWRVPATFFLTTGYVGAAREFWWDEIEAILLSPGTLPAHLTLTIGGEQREWPLGAACRYDDAMAARHAAWRTSQPAPTVRHQLYLALWQALFSLRPSARDLVLDQLRRWSGRSETPRLSYRPLRHDEVKTLANSPVAAIGAHTVTHTRLSALDAAEQIREIRDSRRAAESMIGKPVTEFAYPHGAHDDATVARVAEAGLLTACTTVHAVITPGSSPLRLPRFMVQDWDGATFERQLKAWLE